MFTMLSFFATCRRVRGEIFCFKGGVKNLGANILRGYWEEKRGVDGLCGVCSGL